MKKHLFIGILFSLLLIHTAPVMADWWPSEPYCTFIRRIELDKAWKFTATINNVNDWHVGNQNNDAELVDCPGYIAWQIMVWDNSKSGKNDYDMDWFELSLYNTMTKTTHDIVLMDCLPEATSGDNDWDDNYYHDGNINFTTDANWYKNSNGNNSRFCHKYLFDSWADGIQFAYIVTKYSPETYQFIKDAGNNLQIKLHFKYDYTSWSDYKEDTYYADWKAEHRHKIDSLPMVRPSQMQYKEVPGKSTELSMQLPGLKSANASSMTIQLMSNGAEKGKLNITSQWDGTYSFSTDLMTDSVSVNNGDYMIRTIQERSYPLNMTGYHDESHIVINSPVSYSSPTGMFYVPQVRLAKNANVRNNRDGTLTVSWTAEQPSSNRTYDQSNWVIQYCTDNLFTSPSMKEVEVNYDISKKDYSQDIKISERNKNDLTYYVRICRKLKFTQQRPFYASCQVLVNTDYVHIGTFTHKSDGSNATLNWTLSDGLWTPNMHLLLLKDGQEIKNMTNRNDSPTYTLTQLPYCTPVISTLKVMDNNNLIHSESDTIVVRESQPGQINAFRCSKGYYNARVEISWDVDSVKQNFNYFQIHRKEHGTTSKYKTLTADPISKREGVYHYTYVDNTAAAGVYYDYMLEAVAACQNSVTSRDNQSDIGFTQPYGVVTGQVLFENGQAVPNVTIDLSSEQITKGASLEMNTTAYASLDCAQLGSPFALTGGAAEMYVQMKNYTTSSPRTLAWQEGALFLGFTDKEHLQLKLTRNGNTYTLNTLLNDSLKWNKDAFNHVGMSYSHINSKLLIHLFVNGILAASDTIANVTCQGGIGAVQKPLQFGTATENSTPMPLNGFVDEIRLWNVYRSPEQIANTFDCYLGGKEEGISGYYHCDFLLNNIVYDISGDGSTFNERHLTMHGVETNTNFIPTKEQLALRAHTDEKGNYLINAVPYTKLGTLYTIVPKLGEHQFSPTTKTLFFDDNASTHNNIDFTDISSFTVSGKIVYAGGTYPVEGIQFKVDGTLQLSRKGGAIQTDENGQFALSVPVGVHSVQACLTGHTLTNDGYITQQGQDINYQSNHSDITIADSTRVRFIGRICGGNTQATLPVGFSLSRNNLDEGMYIQLEHAHPDKYKLSNELRTDTITHLIPSAYLQDTINPNRKLTTFQNVVAYSDNYIAIYANDSTGEFYADIPPINYTIRLTVPHYGNASEHGEQLSCANLTPAAKLPELNPYKVQLVSRVVEDSIVYTNPIDITDTVYYNKRQVFVLRTQPTLDFYQVDNNGKPVPHYGEEVISVPTENNEYKLVKLYDPTWAKPYALSRPLYKSGITYLMQTSLGEIYRHYNTEGKATWADTVPVTNAVFRITNTMAQQREKALYSDSTGTAIYAFLLAEPDLIKAEGQIAMRVEYNNNKSTHGWEPPFESGLCYYTGEKKTSGDFITAGPNELITVLRDPPGTGSYSYLDAGYTVNKDRSYCYSSFENGKLGLNFSFGTDHVGMIGLGYAFMHEIRVVTTWKAGWEHDNKWSYKTNVNTSTTLNKRISTSSDEVYVGASGDVFVGNSTNYSIASSNNIQLVERDTYRKAPNQYSRVYAWTADSAHVLALSTGIACNQQFNTTFSYTQSDIINQEIPRLEKLLKSFLRPYNRQDSIECARKANEEKKTYYMCVNGFDSIHQEYGAENTYFMMPPHYTDSAFHCTSDTIQTIYGWIKRWKSCLGWNEYQKWKAFANRDKGNVLVDNYSISGGATLSMNEQYTTARAYNYTYETQNGFFIDRGSSNGVTNEAMLSLTLVFEEHAGNDETINKQTTEQYTHTKGFVLAPNSFERLSIDVLREHDWQESQEMEDAGEWKKDHGKDSTDEVIGTIQSLKSYPSYIFYTRGGQTCCPYEPEVKSEYIAYYLDEQIRILRNKSNRTEEEKKRLAELVNDLNTISSHAVTINGPTLSIDKPQLKALKTYVDGVPSGETAYIPIEMTNASESNTDRAFYLVYKESSNTKGLSVSVDGTGIGTGLTGGSGVSFLIPAGSTLTKTLAITKGSALDYDSIKLYLISYCNTIPNKFAIKDSCTISVHFTPSCSGIDIKLPTSGWVYNTALATEQNPINQKVEHYLPIELNNFDINYNEFDHIELQYKPSSDNNEQWRKVHYFYSDTATLNQALRTGKDSKICSLCKGGTIQYKLFLDEQDDQLYDLRAVTYCRSDNQLVANYSDVVSGIKDMYQPRLFGSAKPANGILGINDEMEFTFNEPIAGGKLTYNNFSVYGILDEAPSDRNISVHLDGEGLMKTEAVLNLSNNFTLEGYFRQTSANGQQTLFTIGTAPQQIQLMLDKQNKRMVLIAAGKQSEIDLGKHWAEGGWNHVALVADANANNTQQITILLNFEVLKTISLTQQVNTEGILQIGDKWVGDVDQVRLWCYPMSDAELRTQSTIRYNNTAVNLICCYNMDENMGSTLEDASGAHTMQMNSHCTWTVPEGRALYLDGQHYAVLPFANSSITSDKDYTLELWFKAAPQKSATLLTTGRQNNANTDYTFTVGITSMGRLYIASGTSYTEISPSVFSLTNTWHHFTFSVSRSNGFARIYVDAQLIATINQDKIGGLAGNMYLGAMLNRYDGDKTDTLTSFYTGYLDEIRVWDCYRPQYQLSHAHMEKPDSIMPELICYYPFERYQTSPIGINELVFSLRNFREGKAAEAITLYGATESQEAAPVITTSALTRLDHTGYTFTPSENSILFTLTKPLSQIEHSLLTFVANDVMDVNGNKIQSSLSWTVYVDRNPLAVDRNQITITSAVGNSSTFDVVLSNRGGTFQPFYLRNLPSWLHCTTEATYVYPASSETLHFVTSESLPIGTHTATIYLSNAEDVVIPLLITILVEGDAPADFTDAGKYPYNMSILGQIKIDGVLSTDTRDMLLVYNQQAQCIGSAHTAYYSDLDAYYVVLQVYNDTTITVPLSYVIYDASTGKQYKAGCDALVHSYQNNAIIGSPDQPAIFYNQQALYHVYNLQEGWNWLSFNLNSANGWTTNNVLGKGWSSGDLVKMFNADVYADYSAKQQSWKGSMTNLDAIHLYAVKVAQQQYFYVLGEPINPTATTIPIASGWNGISYLPQVSLSVAEAMSLFTDVVNGDVVKSQTQFATYYNGSWIGSLKTMHPGEGYMLNHKGKATSLTYPSTYAHATAPARRQSIAYETTMSLMAAPMSIAGQEGDVLRAYCGEEQVGEASLTKGVWYMSIAGDRTDEPLHFVYFGSNGQAVSTTTLPYEAHAVVGSPNQPMPVAFTQTVSALVVYPVPAKYTLYYRLDGAVRYAIYSITGECLQSGAAIGCAQVGGLPTGVYIIEVSTDTDVYRTTFMKE